MSNHDDNENGQEKQHEQHEQHEFADQAERLGQTSADQEDKETGSNQAIKAIFVTPLDPVIQTEDGGRLPVVPVEEAVKLNRLKEKVESEEQAKTNGVYHGKTPGSHGKPTRSSESRQSDQVDAPLRDAIPPSR